MGRIVAVCISEKKGTVKKDVGECRMIEDYGLENDAHAGSGRQVSLLSYEKVEAFRKRSGGAVELPPGVFGENLLIEGFDLKNCPVGTRFKSGEVLLEITQIGKQCHSGCEIMKKTGECIMPTEGVFAKVLKGGTVKNGDEIEKIRAPFRAAIITASDRCAAGEREDKSGPKIEELITQAGYVTAGTLLLTDDEDGLAEALIRIADEEKPDVIFTTGGTGFSPRDRMPEATLRAAERQAPGIAEGIRAYSFGITPKAMLSRAVSVIRGKTLIVNLPGSPKAVEECLGFLLPVLDHGLEILRGEGDA
ncbi:MAG: MOSC domain-containing protein [Lachnospiraceae bacterium]|nr:MOSC domain-containing protein [Lachnospiraceae bacterium]